MFGGSALGIRFRDLGVSANSRPPPYPKTRKTFQRASRYGGDCMVVCNDWHSALVPMLIHAEKPTGPRPGFSLRRLMARNPKAL